MTLAWLHSGHPITSTSSCPSLVRGFGRAVHASQLLAIAWIFSSSAVVCVIGLHKRIGPSAIFWSVRTIVVDAIKRCPFGSFPHVGKEVVEYRPSFANRNAATTVSRVVRCLGIKTSFAHRFPGTIRGRHEDTIANSFCVSVTDAVSVAGHRLTHFRAILRRVFLPFPHGPILHTK